MTENPPSDRPPPPPPSAGGSQRRASPSAIAAAVLAGLVGVAAIVLFMFGQDLFGSDTASIDDYNRTVLDSCDLPENSTLLRTYVLTVNPAPDDSVRTMSYIWASALTADEVAAFYGAPRPGVWTDVSDERACRFGQQPLVLVLDRWAEGSGPMDESTQTAGPDDDVAAEFWGDPEAEITEIAAVPATTRSFLLLRLGQREAEGLLGLGELPLPDRSTPDRDLKPPMTRAR